MSSRSWTRALFDAIDDAVIVHDDQGRILEANPAACRRLGYTRDELLRLTTRDIDDPEFAAGFKSRLQSQLQSGRVQFEGVHRTKDGRRIDVDINTTTIQLDGKAAVLGVSRDITRRKQQERHARAQYEVARIIAADKDYAVSARLILQNLCTALDFDVGLLWQMDRIEKKLCSTATWHHPQLGAAAFLSASRTCSVDASDLPGVVLKETGPRRAECTDAPWASLPRWHAARHAGLQNVLALPIQSGDETIGVLEFWRQRIQGDDDTHLTLLHTMANQIGQFLDRERVEKELRESQALYESLVQSLPQNIFRKDREGRLTFGNERYCESLKRTLPELLGRTDFDLFPAEVARKYVADDRRIMEIGETLDTIEEHYLPDGNRLFVHVVKTPIIDAKGETIGVQGIFWDVTQEVLAHEAVLHSEKRYRQLTEATMDGIVVIDTAGKIVLFNPAAERMFGYRADEILGADASVLVPGEFAELQSHGVAHYLKTHLRGNMGLPQEFKGRRKDGSEFPVEIALSVLNEPGESSSQILAAIRDLTERNKMRSVLVQNEKLASIGLLSAGVAHEINNPLAFVANNLVVLERDCQGLLTLLDLYASAKPTIEPALVEKIDAAAEAIDLDYVKGNMMRILNRSRDGLDRVTRIVHSLRGMARTDAPHRQDARIPDLVNSSLEILHGKFKALGVTIEQQHDMHPSIRCVPTQISQVILNLLVNAFQAIESSGRNDGRVAIRTERLPEELLLEVSDNGAGIEPENVPKLFDPFFTTKDVGEGTGLGLSISHHIVTAHGGRIEVDSTLGEGTAFRVYLPLKGI
jgi:PAS domain S-box-containing protein